MFLRRYRPYWLDQFGRFLFILGIYFVHLWTQIILRTSLVLLSICKTVAAIPLWIKVFVILCVAVNTEPPWKMILVIGGVIFILVTYLVWFMDLRSAQSVYEIRPVRKKT